MKLRIRKVKYGTSPSDMLIIYNEYGIQDYAVLEYWDCPFDPEVTVGDFWKPVEIVDDI